MIASPATSPPLLAQLFRGLADPARLSCLLAVRDGPRTVGEIVAETGLSQPNVSKHLACLHGCGLVHAERTGRYVVYEIASDDVERVIGAAEHLLRDVRSGDTPCPICGSRARGPLAGT